jgi:hypothetical protein
MNGMTANEIRKDEVKFFDKRDIFNTRNVDIPVDVKDTFNEVIGRGKGERKEQTNDKELGTPLLDSYDFEVETTDELKAMTVDDIAQGKVYYVKNVNFTYTPLKMKKEDGELIVQWMLVTKENNGLLKDTSTNVLQKLLTDAENTTLPRNVRRAKMRKARKLMKNMNK